MKDWIWHQKFWGNDATSVGSYYNISNDSKSGLFVSSFDDVGPFERSKQEKQTIGFPSKCDHAAGEYPVNIEI
jgi:hypothetical protein